jgi:hypothetical protein
MTWLCQIDWVAVSAIALVIVTAYYAWSTHKILKESQETRKAVQRQAFAMEESNKLLRQQIQESFGLGGRIIRSTIEIALQNIDYWKKQNISNLANHRALPIKIELVPTDSQFALHHASRISQEGYSELLLGINSLTFAQNELEILKGDHIGAPGFIQDHTERAIGFIDNASGHLNAAKKYLW